MADQYTDRDRWKTTIHVHKGQQVDLRCDVCGHGARFTLPLSGIIFKEPCPGCGVTMAVTVTNPTEPPAGLRDRLLAWWHRVRLSALTNATGPKVHRAAARDVDALLQDLERKP